MKHYMLLSLLLTASSFVFSQNEPAEKSKQQINGTEIVSENEIIVPEGFSPNGDEIHDVFEVKGLEKKYPNFKMEIFNDKGVSVWKYKHDGNSGNTPKWWDGKVDGDTAEKGIYSYEIKFNDGLTKNKSGSFILTK